MNEPEVLRSPVPRMVLFESIAPLDIREPVYQDISIKPTPRTRVRCRCGNMMFWDRLEGEWECICGRRHREWRK